MNYDVLFGTAAGIHLAQAVTCIAERGILNEWLLKASLHMLMAAGWLFCAYRF